MTSSTKKENHTMRTALGGVALLLTIAATAAGCSDSDDNTAPPPSSTPAEPTTSPTPKTPEDRASAAAESAMRRYFATTNAVAANPRKVAQLKKVETGTLLSADQSTFNQWASKGWRQTGRGTFITKMSAEVVDLDNRPATVTVTVCAGVDGDVVDEQGQSVVKKGGPKVLTTKYTVANYAKGHPESGWLVATAEDQAVGSCTL